MHHRKSGLRITTRRALLPAWVVLVTLGLGGCPDAVQDALNPPSVTGGDSASDAPPAAGDAQQPGAPGADGGNGANGADGTDGANGSGGASGANGQTGATGADGADGATGPQGPAGADGAAGPQGPSGADGALGPQGPAGADGAAGPQGPAGADGAIGPVGPAGETGPAGADGAPGPQGEPGPAGAPGPEGPQGPQGPPGDPASVVVGEGLTKEGDVVLLDKNFTDGRYLMLGGNDLASDAVLGATSDVAVEIVVGGDRALRLEPTTDAPNIIAGFAGNSVAPTVLGAAVIGGGSADDGLGNDGSHRVTDNFGTIIGGVRNLVGNSNGDPADAAFSTIIGGFGNVANGAAATVVGGELNTARGNHSFAAGRMANAFTDGSFVWADSIGEMLSSSVVNEFRARASGGFWLSMGKDPNGAEMFLSLKPTGNRFADTSTGAFLSRGGVWTNVSDRDLKFNVQPLDRAVLLEQLAGVPITRWSYLAEGAEVQHIGPMAQDFYQAFALGGSATSIGTVDADGVALAGVQALYELSKQQRAQIDAQAAQIQTQQAALQQQQARLERLEAQLAVLLAGK